MSTTLTPFNSSTHVMEIRYQWPPDVVVSNELCDLVRRIFCVADERCTVDDVISHAWMNDNGHQNEITRHALLVLPTHLNESILVRMESLGLPRADVEEDVLKEEHNQFSTTYALLEFQLEDRGRIRSGSDLSEASSPSSERSSGREPDSSPSATLGSSPTSLSSQGTSPQSSSFGESLRSSLRDSQKRCVIA